MKHDSDDGYWETYYTDEGVEHVNWWFNDDKDGPEYGKPIADLHRWSQA